MGRSHQPCPENPRNKQTLTNSIANRSDNLLGDAQFSTDVSYEDENEGNAVDSSNADCNVTANAVEAKAINNEAALPLTAKYSEIWIHSRPDFSR
ncbi:hypothetical protein MAM1_0105d05408 [Mucor ambiguus]|uniref:Uncharacterized protein n=1 Tax=Mucor ambiguus TaxID=91626 RepID=A0A0C9MRJ9_9FUNG|nr:hypothetical protein MAM1_0105d05408 [Mucor ambiguus]